MATGAIIARIISEYSDKGTKAAKKDLKQAGKDFDDFAAKVQKAFTISGVAVGGLAAKIGFDAVKAAVAFEKSSALLANTLRNTTGATDESIASAQAYIKATELRLGITDEQLRPSLAALATATHSVTEAEKLQQLALDISAGKGKSLESVSIALAKAYGGNFNALKRLGIPLTEASIKSKDFNTVIKELSANVGGAATVAANTLSGRMNRIQQSFEEVKKTLGKALLPVIERFLDILTNQILPNVQNWVDLNREKLAKSLADVATFIGHLLLVAIKFSSWISNHLTLIKALAGLLAGMFAAAKVIAFVGALEKIVAVMKTLRTVAAGAAIAEAFATGGTSILAASAAIAALGIVGTSVFGALDGQVDTASTKFDNLAGTINNARLAAYYKNHPEFAPKTSSTAPPPFTNDMASVVAQNQLLISQTAQQKIQEKITNNKKAQQVLDSKAASDAAASAKRQADEAAKQLKINKEIAAIKKLGGGTAQSTDPIELEAARLLLVKQGHLLELEKLKAMKDAADLQKAIADSAQRYSDILSVIADGKITSDEIVLLAHKWGDTTSEVENYVARVIGANSTKANTDEVLSLYESWGMTKDQAAKYLSFTEALKDQKLSDQEITNLEKKWNLSKEQVLAYVKAVTDGTAFDVTKITTPGDAAAAGWKNALNSLNDYLTAAKSGTGGVGGADVGGSSMLGGRTNEIGGNLGSGGVADTMASLFSAINAPTASFATSGFLAGASGTATGSTGGSSTPVNVTVNVAGSVTTQNDLTEAIRANLQNGLLSGRALGFNTAGL
jgi:hypothetical protein